MSCKNCKCSTEPVSPAELRRRKNASPAGSLSELKKVTAAEVKDFAAKVAHDASLSSTLKGAIMDALHAILHVIAVQAAEQLEREPSCETCLHDRPYKNSGGCGLRIEGRIRGFAGGSPHGCLGARLPWEYNHYVWDGSTGRPE